jgi:hypothetical protein
MKLWFDCQSVQTASRLRGIGKYSLNLLQHIRKQRPDWTLICSLNAGISNQVLIARDLLEPIVGGRNVVVWEGLPVLGEAIGGDTLEREFNRNLLGLHVSEFSPDWAISLSPFEGMFDGAVPFVGGTRAEQTAVIFYDNIPAAYPDQYLSTKTHSAAHYSRLQSLRRFREICAISEFSASEFKKIDSTAKVSVIGCSHDLETDEIWHRKSRDSDVSVTIVYVGGSDYRKR